jgi:predicted Zn-ribbon and HTH transcriptional regulator
MSADQLILLYVTSLLAALAGIAIYSKRRARSFQPTASHDSIYRCAKCGFVYTDDADVDRSRCSQCGKTNEAIEF